MRKFLFILIWLFSLVTASLYTFENPEKVVDFGEALVLSGRCQVIACFQAQTSNNLYLIQSLIL